MWLIKFFFKLLWYSFLAVLPVLLLTRLSIYLHNQHQYHAYMSIGIAAVAVVLILFIYLYRIHRFIRGRESYRKLPLWRKLSPSFFIVLGALGYFLLYINAANIKNDAISEQYLNLHPVLRLSMSIFVQIDQEAVITDLERSVEDYHAMGLPALRNSLHYPQSDGYVHAIDLRTNGRTNLRNDLTKMCFDLLGFNTLRHVGTADHLHISIKTHDFPGAI